jgi:hypothetical protein
MEEADRFQLVDSFQLRPDHPDLNGECNDEQDVIARNVKDTRMWNREDRQEKRKRSFPCALTWPI